MTASTRHLCMAWTTGALLALTACGGGSSADPPAVTEIGAAGGTVAGPGGASLTVPAGALAAAAPLVIARSTSGSPALPAGTETAGDMHALTPHGTSFAQPVTLTLPFDPARVPAGRELQLLQTTVAQDGWEAVAGATVDGAVLTAQLNRFSWVVAVVAPQASGLTGTWTSLYSCDTSDGGGFSGEEALVITQTGNNVSFTASDGSTGSGTIAGNVVTWTSAGPGYTESGTWTIGATALIKRSTYVNTDGSGGGTCAGSIHRDS